MQKPTKLYYGAFICCVLTNAILQASDISTFKNENNVIRYTENRGQVSDQYHHVRPDVLFYGNTSGMSYFLRNDGISYQFYRYPEQQSSPDGLESLSMTEMEGEISIYRLDVNWIGMNKEAMTHGAQEYPGVENFYLSVCPEGINGVRSYGNVYYRNLYDGIDLRYYNRDQNLEYDFIVAPGADYRQISWEIEGVENIYINGNGHLVMETPLGKLEEKQPVAYQGEKRIDAHWSLDGSEVSIEVGDYNEKDTLVIDPVVLVWGTYQGGSGGDSGGDLKVDQLSVYVAGASNSASMIATSGSHQVSIGSASSNDAFLSKFDLDGNRIWSTYYGGSDSDVGSGVTTDKASNVYLTGQTRSPNAIATSGTFQATIGGSLEDAFLVKFDANGNRIWGTYYGRLDRDVGGECVVDSGYNIYMYGRSRSDSLATPGSHQFVQSGDFDALLVKFDSTGNRIWSTYLGGPDLEGSGGCALDASMNVYISGTSFSTTGIATAGSHQPGYGGGVADAFAAKFDGNGTLLWSTYMGGDDSELSYDMIIDKDQNAIMTGYTLSDTGIATAGTQQDTLNGLADIFLVKFDPAGNRVWGTYYGGDESDYGIGLVSDSESNIFVAGLSNSKIDFATSGVHQDTLLGTRDPVLAKFDDSGQRIWATYYGASGTNPQANAVGVDLFSQVYICGVTSGSVGYTTPGSHQSTIGGGADMFLAKFSDCKNGEVLDVTACDSYTEPNNGQTWTTSGIYFDTLMNSNGCDSLLMYLLEINQSQAVNIVDTSCDTYTSATGKTYVASGMYVDTLSTVMGCDSLITLDLTIVTIDTGVTVMAITTTSKEMSGTYQWLDCNDNFAAIPGQTGQQFTPEIPGDYAVAIEKNGCTDTSACVTIEWLGIPNPGGAQISYWPNPVSNELYLNGLTRGGTIAIYDQPGKLVFRKKIPAADQSTVTIPVDMKNGIYIMKLTTGAHTWIEKLIVEKK